MPPLLREYNGDGEELVVYIIKALYGLKSAGHALSVEILTTRAGRTATTGRPSDTAS